MLMASSIKALEDKLNEYKTAILMAQLAGEESKELGEIFGQIETLSSNIDGYALPQREPGIEPSYGLATAYNQNCSFHCLAETLFHLPDEKLEIIQHFHGFQ